MQVDALAQGLANASFLALPAFIIGSNSSPTLSTLEIIGLIIWIAAFIMEATADAQKLSFLRQMAALPCGKRCIRQLGAHPIGCAGEIGGLVIGAAEDGDAGN